MADRAALATGAPSGIGTAIAHMLGEVGHGLTVAARLALHVSPACVIPEIIFQRPDESV